MKKLCLVGLFSVLFSTSAAAYSVEHEFMVTIGPFEASKTAFTYSLSPDSYEVRSMAETFGVFDALYPFRANYFTSGKIRGQNLITDDYHYVSYSRFNKRTKQLVYNNNGLPVCRISSKNDEKKKVEIEQKPENKDTTDLQTAFAELARQYSRYRFCDSRMRIFDGKRRFDVIFRDEGQENLLPGPYSAIAGKAAKCSFHIDKLDSDGDDLLWKVTSERPVYFWIMEDEKQKKPFIAKISLEKTPLGRLDVYATRVTVKE